jgi:hypothetical protein
MLNPLTLSNTKLKPTAFMQDIAEPLTILHHESAADGGPGNSAQHYSCRKTLSQGMSKDNMSWERGSQYIL